MRTIPTVFLDGHGCFLFSSWLDSILQITAILAGFGKAPQVPSSKEKGRSSFASLQTTKKQAVRSIGWSMISPVYGSRNVSTFGEHFIRGSFLLLMKMKLGLTSYQPQGAVRGGGPPCWCVKAVTVCIFLSSHKAPLLKKMVFHGCVNTVSTSQDDRGGGRGLRMAQHFHSLITFIWGSQLMLYLGHLHFLPMTPWEAKQRLANSPQHSTVEVMKLNVRSNRKGPKRH